MPNPRVPPPPKNTDEDGGDVVWNANNRHHLGFLNPPIDQPLSPHLLFFLDPGRAYKVMQVYLFLLASWQAQCKLIAMYPAVVDVLSGLSFLPDVQPNWDTAISILPLTEYAYQDNSDYRPPPLIMFQRFMRVRVIDVATITQASLGLCGDVDGGQRHGGGAGHGAAGSAFVAPLFVMDRGIQRSSIPLAHPLPCPRELAVEGVMLARLVVVSICCCCRCCSCCLAVAHGQGGHHHAIHGVLEHRRQRAHAVLSRHLREAGEGEVALDVAA